MNRGQLLFLFCALIFSASSAFAQTNNSEKVDEKTADVVITARVLAKELTFETVPNPKVEFPGTPERKTEWSSERENLPESVQSGVTYRNIGITLKIVSVFADIDKIVDEALGIAPKPETDNKETAKTDLTSANKSKKPEIAKPKKIQPKK